MPYDRAGYRDYCGECRHFMLDKVRGRAAAELREASTGAYRHVDALDVIAGSIGVELAGKFSHEVEKETYTALADLIGPTCEMTPQGDGFRCSACGTYHDMSGFDEFPWPRCPECGSRVKGSNSMPLGGEGR